jgi:Ubp3 associated protein Bre5.
MALLAGSITAFPQPGNGRLPEQIRYTFLKDSLLVEENTYAFNNVTLTNNSNRSLHVQLVFTAPEMADIVSGQVTEADILPGATHTIPIRIIPVQKTAAVAWYAVGVEMRFKELGQVIRSAFYIMPKETVKWKAAVKQPSVIFLQTDRQVPFEILLQNTGNSTDQYSFDFQTGLSLNLPKKNHTVSLEPGESQTVRVQVQLSPRDIQQTNKEEILIFIRNRLGEQKMLVQQIARLGTVYSGEPSAWQRMPLTLELGLQNLAGDQPFAFVNARGFLKLGDHEQVNLFLQTNNFYRNFTANTQRATVEYVHGPWQITGGSIMDFNNFLVDGFGGRVQYSAGQRSYEVMGVKSRFGNTNQLNIKISQPVLNMFNWQANAFINDDKDRQLTSSLLLNTFDFRINQSTRFSVEAGTGREKLHGFKPDTALAGWQAGYAFETKKQHWQLNSVIHWYSNNFPGLNKGYHYQLHETRALFNRFFVGPYFELNKRGFNNIQDSVISYLFNINSREYGLRWGWQGKKFSLTASPGVFTQVQDSANAMQAKMYKVSVNANWQWNSRWWLSLFSNAGKIALPGKPLLNSFTSFVNLQSGKYGMQIRYDHGPYYYYEIKDYVQTPRSYGRFQLSPYYELSPANKRFFYRVQMNYLEERHTRNSFLLVHNQVQYSMPKAGLDLGVTAQVNVLKKEDPLVNLVIRKKLQMPVYRNNKLRTFKMVLFLDKNNNHQPDAGEERVANVHLLINNELVTTNEKGEVECRNTDEPAFTVDFSKVAFIKGWMPQQGFLQVFKPGKDQKIIPVPFTPGRVLNGKLLLVRDEQSSTTMPLNSIRVTAVGANGEVYNTLTNAQGAFYFNLPAGNYIISINQAVFNDNFRPDEISKTADLLSNTELPLQFVIKQKKRVMNIRRE